VDGQILPPHMAAAGSQHLLARGGPEGVPRIASVWGNSICRPKIPLEIVPTDAKTYRAGSCAWLCTMFSLCFGGTQKKPPQKPVWVSQGRPNPRWDGERWEFRVQPAMGDPDGAAGAFGVTSTLLPTHVSTRDALSTRLRSEISPPKTKGTEQDGCRRALGAELSHARSFTPRYIPAR